MIFHQNFEFFTKNLIPLKVTKLDVFLAFEAAAKLGTLPEATYRLGLSHITGYGTKIDMAQGISYFFKKS